MFTQRTETQKWKIVFIFSLSFPKNSIKDFTETNMHIYNAKDRVTLTVIVDQVQHGSGQLELCIKISHPDKKVEISGYNIVSKSCWSGAIYALTMAANSGKWRRKNSSEDIVEQLAILYPKYLYYFSHYIQLVHSTRSKFLTINSNLAIIIRVSSFQEGLCLCISECPGASREVLQEQSEEHNRQLPLKEHYTFFWKGSFYNSPRVKQMSFTVFESIQSISGSGGSTFSLA